VMYFPHVYARYTLGLVQKTRGVYCESLALVS
jgi:hypothetical protein